MLAAFALLLAWAPAASAEGPGYGGDADTLHVAWVPAPQEAPEFLGSARGMAVMIPAATGADAPEFTLAVSGLGFRALSAVTVRVGSGEPQEARADSAGAVSIVIPPREVGSASPGLTVVASGFNMSGTTTTLLGSVPPAPRSGFDPSMVAPWLVAAGALALLVARRRNRAARVQQP
jgi:hypothetical protein